MFRIHLLKKMNEHPGIAAGALCVLGYFLHLLYEYVHWPKPVMALIVFVGAGIAGWAIDLIFTKSEEEAGEID
jgi:hypothetical protein